MNFWDILRVVAAVLYIGVIAQTVAVMSLYRLALKNELARGRAVKGLLPLHVLVVSIVLILLSGEAVFQNLDRLGEGFSVYVVLNPIIFTMANVALWIILNFENRRYKASRQ